MPGGGGDGMTAANIREQVRQTIERLLDRLVLQAAVKADQCLRRGSMTQQRIWHRVLAAIISMKLAVLPKGPN